MVASHWQFSFFLAISEVNAANLRDRAKDGLAETVLTFQKNLAIGMLDTVLDKLGGRIRDASCCLLQLQSAIVGEHSLPSHPKFTGKWEGRS